MPAADMVLEFRQLTPELAQPLADFFGSLTHEDVARFHPHALTPEVAQQLCGYQGRDLYFAAVCDQRVIGYGLLRGWDEGYAIPSLGIALRPDLRGTGLARALMLFLHGAARLRGAERLRLTVTRSNARAAALYRSLGYVFEEKNSEEDVGFVDLSPG
jgi:ribosomal-protein-alanine N-acetyltransferase